MPLATADTIQEHTAFEEAVALRLAKSAAVASAQVRRRLGAAYGWAATGDGAAPHLAALTQAETLVCVGIGLPKLNLNAAGDPNGLGFVRSTGFDESRQETMSHRELLAYASGFEDDAETLLQAIDDAYAEGERDATPPIYIC